MFIERKNVNGMEIYIRSNSTDIDAMYKIGNKEVSFINYGHYYSLDLFEYEDELYVIRRCEHNTRVIPVVICDGYATWGKVTDEFVRDWLSDEQIENLFKQGRFKTRC